MNRVGKIRHGKRIEIPDCYSIIYKFVVAREGDDSVFYAMQKDPYDDLTHSYVVEIFGLGEMRILGGGSVTIEDKDVRLYGTSHMYGGVRTDVIESLAPAILEAYKELYPEVEKIRWDDIAR